MFASIGEATGAKTVADDPPAAPVLDAYGDPIIYLHHPRRLPSGTFSLLAFGPRSHSASEDDFTAIGFHRDPARVDLGAPPEGLLDLAFDLDGRDAWFELDRVDDA